MNASFLVIAALGIIIAGLLIGDYVKNNHGGQPALYVGLGIGLGAVIMLVFALLP